MGKRLGARKWGKVAGGSENWRRGEARKGDLVGRQVGDGPSKITQLSDPPSPRRSPHPCPSPIDPTPHTFVPPNDPTLTPTPHPEPERSAALLIQTKKYKIKPYIFNTKVYPYVVSALLIPISFGLLLRWSGAFRGAPCHRK